MGALVVIAAIGDATRAAVGDEFCRPRAPARGENVSGACVQLNPPTELREGMAPPAKGLGVRIVGRPDITTLPVPGNCVGCIGEPDRWA